MKRQAELLGYCPYLGMTLKQGLYDLFNQLPVKITRPDKFYDNRRGNAHAMKYFGRSKIISGREKKIRYSKICELFCGIQYPFVTQGVFMARFAKKMYFDSSRCVFANLKHV